MKKLTGQLTVLGKESKVSRPISLYMFMAEATFI
jgi:hypothetical protein